MAANLIVQKNHTKKKNKKYRLRNLRNPVDKGSFEFFGNIFTDTHVNETFNMGGVWWNIKSYISNYLPKQYPDSTRDFLSVELSSKHEASNFLWRASFWAQFHIKNPHQDISGKENPYCNMHHLFNFNINKQKIVIKKLVLCSDLNLEFNGVYTLIFTFIMRNLKFLETKPITFSSPTNILNKDPDDSAAIKVQGKVFYISKGYVSFYSKYFQNLFAQNPNLNEFEIDLVNEEDFSEMLKIIYPLRKPIKSKDAQRLLKVANLFEIRTIRAECQKVLLGRKCRISLLERMNIADEYNFVQLKVRVLKLANSLEEVKKLLVGSLKKDTYEMVLRKYDKLLAEKKKKLGLKLNSFFYF